MLRKTASQIIQESHIRQHPRDRVAGINWQRSVTHHHQEVEQYALMTDDKVYQYHFDAELYTVVDARFLRRTPVGV